MTADWAGLASAFASPPSASRPWAFWFLNDDTPLPELLEQLDAFAEAGFGTVCPCARIGLSEEIGYLTPTWWEFMRAIVAHCAELGLRVVLYDEASYPSGAANGLVTQQNPEYASRCLRRASVEVDLAPEEVRYVRPQLGRSLWDRRVATVVTTASGRTLVTPEEGGLVRLTATDLGTGRVRVTSFFDAPSGGTIRGAHAWQDDGSALAPASADLMNPAAVAAFLHLTHDAYAQHLGTWFGSTIVAMFTDEPEAIGRHAHADAVSWTPGFEADLAAAAGASIEETLLHLEDVFDGGPWARTLEDAVGARVGRIYHAAQRAWCDAHGIALTGHPKRADEVEALASFTWPGQDVVWRWVLPGPTALHGDQSAAPRSAASAAILRRRADPTDVVPVVNEVYGAYGWQLSFDEMKWLADWLSVRGTTAFLVHALFASVRDNRAYESEPDVGLHHAWWPKLPTFLAYLARTSMLGEALTATPSVAVAVVGDRVPVDEVAPLYEHQIGFVYAPVSSLPGAGFSTVVCRPADADAVRAALPKGPVVIAEGDRWWEGLTPEGPRVASGKAADLRVRAGSLAGLAGVQLTNEGEDAIVVETAGAVWDPWTGQIVAAPPTWTLQRRASIWLTDAVPACATTLPDTCMPGPAVALSGWSTDHPDIAGLGDWTRTPPCERFAGTVTYRAAFELDAASDLLLDLGKVGDAASIRVNGEPVAASFWAPYRCRIATQATVAGENIVEVAVTNSMANRYEGALLPSGLLGPVRLNLAAPSA